MNVIERVYANNMHFLLLLRKCRRTSKHILCLDGFPLHRLSLDELRLGGLAQTSESSSPGLGLAGLFALRLHLSLQLREQDWGVRVVFGPAAGRVIAVALDVVLEVVLAVELLAALRTIVTDPETWVVPMCPVVLMLAICLMQSADP